MMNREQQFLRRATNRIRILLQRRVCLFAEITAIYELIRLVEDKRNLVSRIRRCDKSENSLWKETKVESEITLSRCSVSSANRVQEDSIPLSTMKSNGKEIKSA